MLGESGPVELGSCLHPTLHPTPGFTIFSQWLVPVLFSCVFSRDIWSQEPGITRCWELRSPSPTDLLGGGVTVRGTGQELLLRFPHPTELFGKPEVILFFFSSSIMVHYKILSSSLRCTVAP